jgi:hypothetical protein
MLHDADERSKELVVNLERSRENLNVARLQATLNEYQVRSTPAIVVDQSHVLALLTMGTRFGSTHQVNHPRSAVRALSPSPQAQSDEHAALLIHLQRDTAEGVEARAVTSLLAERLHRCEESLAQRASADELRTCVDQLRATLLSKVRDLSSPGQPHDSSHIVCAAAQAQGLESL